MLSLPEIRGVGEPSASAALANYRDTSLRALADAQIALEAMTAERDRLARIRQATQANSRAAGIARRLYEDGLAEFLALLDAERRQTESEDALIQSDTRLRLATVRLYRSLGGGW